MSRYPVLQILVVFQLAVAVLNGYRGQPQLIADAYQHAGRAQERIESIADEADLEEVYNTERHLLYVACTRARDNLLVTSARPASEFLEDLEI